MEKPMRTSFFNHLLINGSNTPSSTRMTKKRQLQSLKRWIIVPLGGVVFVVGLVLFPLPIPFGLILMLLGLFMMASNPFVLRFLRRTRSRFPAISAKLRDATPHLPAFLARFLRRTDSPKRTKPAGEPDQAS